jgi:hypothetical protein
VRMTARDDHRGPTVQNLPADQLHLGNPGYRHVDAFIEQLSATAMPQRLPSCRDPRCLLPQLPNQARQPLRAPPACPPAHLPARAPDWRAGAVPCRIESATNPPNQSSRLLALPTPSCAVPPITMRAQVGRMVIDAAPSFDRTLRLMSGSPGRSAGLCPQTAQSCVARNPSCRKPARARP